MPDQPSQREYWSGRAGDEWVANAENIDAQLAPVTQAALEAAAFRPGEHVLDIGCGGGRTSLEIARRVSPGGSVFGVDLSPQLPGLARERARRAGLDVEFLQADAGEASFPRRFDAAFSRFGVMFFEAPSRAFAHLRSSLQPGGRLTFVCWRTLAENRWTTTLLAAIEPMLETPLPLPDPDAPGPHALGDPGKLRTVLSEAGWRDVVLSPWDGDLSLRGGGTLEEISDFVLRLGGCARVVAEQGLDVAEARRRVRDCLAPLHENGAVRMPAACWVVTATA